MENEAHNMEMKLDRLRKMTSSVDANKTSGSGDSCGRWRSSADKKPARHGSLNEALGPKPSRTCQAAPCAESGQSSEVEAFLAGLGLDRYVSLFAEHGFDSMDAVREMGEAHMRDVGMAAGHVIKLKKRLAELKPVPARSHSATLQDAASATVQTERKQSESETQQGAAPIEEKLCCYQCYKQFYAHFAVERCSPLPDGGPRKLCSPHCAELWSASMQAKAEEIQKRQARLAKHEEMQRMIDFQLQATGGQPVIAA